MSFLNPYRFASAGTPSPLAAMFASGEIGDHWKFDNVHTNQTVVSSDITQAPGWVNGQIMTPGPGTTNPTLNQVSSNYCMKTQGVGSLGSNLIYNFGSSIPQPGTIILCLGDSETATHVIATGSSTTSRWQISDSGAGDIIMFAGSTLDTTLNEGAGFGTRVVTAEFNGASSKFYSNGTLLVTGSAGTQSTNQLTIGSLYDGSFGGTINFFGAVFINRLLTSTERDTAERELGGYAGLSW